MSWSRRRARGATPVRKRARLDALAQLLDLGAVDRAAPADDLEAVVLGRVVAAGDHHAAVGLEVEHREVERRAWARRRRRRRRARRPAARACSVACRRGEDSRQSRPSVMRRAPASREVRARSRRPSSATKSSGRSRSATPRMSYSRKTARVHQRVLRCHSRSGRGRPSAPRRAGARPGPDPWARPARRRRWRPPPDRSTPTTPTRGAPGSASDDVAVAVDHHRVAEHDVAARVGRADLGQRGPAADVVPAEAAGHHAEAGAPSP